MQKFFRWRFVVKKILSSIVVALLLCGCAKKDVASNQQLSAEFSNNVDILINVDESKVFKPDAIKVDANKSENFSQKEYEGIVAVVNDEIITLNDLRVRIAMTLLSSGGNVTADLQNQIQKEVLSEMINEIVKYQCAKKYQPKGGWVDRKTVQETFNGIAERNNMTHDSFVEFLKKNGIDKEIIISQIRTNLSWIEYIKARFGKLVNVANAEVKKTLTDIKEKNNQESFYISRMFFPITDAKKEMSLLAHVNNINNMLTKGANFGALARQFSQGSEASRGGEIGWVFHGQLSQEENLALSKMRVGSSTVVRSNRGYVILFLKDKKEAGVQSFTVVKFKQIMAPFSSPNPQQEEIARLISYITEMKKIHGNCNDFMKATKDSGVCEVSDETEAALENMQPQFREIVSSIKVGHVGMPIITPNGILTICVLSKKVEKIAEPSMDEIRSHKMSERLSIFAARELQDLKKKAEIQIAKKYKLL